jgi:hypothetical protein
MPAIEGSLFKQIAVAYPATATGMSLPLLIEISKALARKAKEG